MKILSSALLLILFLSACSNNTQKIKVGDKYSLVLPDYLSETDELNDDASLQYQNTEKEFYTIVIDENKQELFDIIDQSELLAGYQKNLEGYSKLLLDGLIADAGLAVAPKVQDETINGLPAKILSTTLDADGFRVYYKIAMIEGKADFYQVMTWTMESNATEHEEEMEGIVRSFVEK